MIQLVRNVLLVLVIAVLIDKVIWKRIDDMIDAICGIINEVAEDNDG